MRYRTLPRVSSVQRMVSYAKSFTRNHHAIRWCQSRQSLSSRRPITV